MTNFSVVINTCDRADCLRTILYALNHQTYPDFEVIVVVGPTKDNTLDLLADEFDRRVVVVSCPDFNLSRSRNDGIAAAAGDVVAFIDDDAVPANTWLEQLAAAFDSTAAAGLGGRVYYNVIPGYEGIRYQHGAVSGWGDFIWERQSADVALPSVPPPALWCAQFVGTNMAFRRDALAAVGGFDEYFPYLYEDPDICLRLLAKGFTLQTLDNATVYHAPASSRNRPETEKQQFVYNSNWYLEMRGIIYYMLKNVRHFRGLAHALIRAYEYSKRTDIKAADFLEQGRIPRSAYPQVKRQLRRGRSWGYRYGLTVPRQLRRHMPKPSRAFVPFLNKDSAYIPSVYPVPVVKNKLLPMDEKALRICLLSEEYPPLHTEGIARSSYVLAFGLSELGHEVHVLTRAASTSTKVYGGAYVHGVDPTQDYAYAEYPGISALLNYSGGVYQKLKSVIADHKVQLVESPLWHVEGLVSAIRGDLPVVVHPVTGARQLAQMYNRTSDNELKIMGDLEEKFLGFASGLAINSTATHKTLEDVYHIDLSRYRAQLTPFGIIPIRDEDVPPMPSSEPPIVLFLGRLEQRKGILDLFAAIPQVAKEFPNVQFWFAGKDNSLGDGFRNKHKVDYPAYFARKYPQHQGNVEFLGFVDERFLPKLFEVCSLFVAPSLYESFGLIYVEAMNYARPAIGCTVGGAADIIVNGETGYLVPPESPNDLAAAIVNALRSRKCLEGMGKAGRQRMLDKFTHLTMARSFVSLYRDILSQR